MAQNVYVLILINFLHFFGSGVVILVFSRHIKLQRGSQLLLGTLQSAVFVAQRISPDLLELFTTGKKFVLGFSLYCCVVYFTLLIFFSSWWLVFLARISYALTSQVLPYSKEYVSRMEPSYSKIKVFNLLDTAKVTGLALGSILGGYLYEYYEDFSLNATVASVLSLACTLLLSALDSDVHYNRLTHRRESQIFTYRKSLIQQYKNLKKTDIFEDSFNVALKLSFISTFAVYFSRFGFIVGYNYRVNTITGGFTRAYHYTLTFLCTFVAPFFKETSDEKKCWMLQHTMFIGGVSLLALYYAPTYFCFLVCYVPVMFCYILAMSLIEDNTLGIKSRMNIHYATETIANLIHIFVPITYGIICQVIGKHVSKILSLVPGVICLYLVHKRFVYLKTGKIRPTEEFNERQIFVQINDILEEKHIEENEETESRDDN